MRYIGSKQRLLTEIEKVIDSYSVDSGTILDAFCGTGSVSEHFKNKYKVISCDLLKVCYTVTKCKLTDKTKLEFKGLETEHWFSKKAPIDSVLSHMNGLDGIDGYVTTTFAPKGKRMYFTDENARKIDAMNELITSWKNCLLVTDTEFEFLLGCMIESISLVANTAGTYGSFNKTWDPRSKHTILLKDHFSTTSTDEHISIHGDVINNLSYPHDILYLDPPYNKRQYGSYYHVIETIVRNDKPIVKGITGLRDWSDTKSKFCGKDAAEQLRRIIAGTSAKLVVMSYNNEGILSKSEIETILGNIGDVKCSEVTIGKYNSGSGTAGEAVVEYIFSVSRRTQIDKAIYENNVFNENCIDGMKRLPSESVDMILTDLPYGLTECRWDSVIPLPALWTQYKRVIKPNGAIVLFGQQPFTSQLIMSNPEMFKYSLVWKKSKTGNFAQAPYRFLSEHEDIVVFSFGKTAKNGVPRMKFNPQGTLPCNKKMKGKTGDTEHRGGRETQPDYIQTVTNYPRSILEFANEGKPVHPTQKPIKLCEYLINSYSDENDLVLDSCMGVGTTALACRNIGRRFVGFELDEKNFQLCRERLGEDSTRL
jgi:site-specific DNA-methyltransferase (adenine-specific)